MLDEFLIEIRALRQDHVSTGTLVSVSPVDLKRDVFSAEVCSHHGGVCGCFP